MLQERCGCGSPRVWKPTSEILPEEADLLARLAEAPEQRLKMADVSRALRLSKSGVTRLVDRLAERGLVVRAACPSDRRVVYAGLTAEGSRAAAEAAPALAAGVAEHLAGRLSVSELDALSTSLGEISTHPPHTLEQTMATRLETDQPETNRPEPAKLDPGTDIGHVHLKVADLDRALEFYQGTLGFELTGRLGDQAAFVSAGGYHHHIGLNTWESRGGSPPPRGTTGLYHVAIRYPTRPALARALRALIERRYPLEGAADHAVSEAIYLHDPDGNGLELYWDRPREEWPVNEDGSYAMVVEALDLEGLLAEAAED